MSKKRNPFMIPTKNTVLMRVHKDMKKVIERERKKQQRISDMKFGKGKFKVKSPFASKIIGGFLK